MDILKQFENRLLIRFLSKNTIATYLRIAHSLLDYDKDFFISPQEKIIRYLSDKIKKGCSSSYILQHISVIDFIRNDILDISDKVKIKRPVRESTIPDILTKDEFLNLFNACQNIKHRAIIALMYSTGMRVGEVVTLLMKDVDSGNNKIIIRKPKGNIDRIVMLDVSVLELLRNYFKEYNPVKYLFNGQKGGMYSARSIQELIKNNCRKAGITKNISSHSLRHSCFTQLIKDGVDLRLIQRLAGHKNINTTAGYIRVTDIDVLDIQSPIKSIGIK